MQQISWHKGITDKHNNYVALRQMLHSGSALVTINIKSHVQQTLCLQVTHVSTIIIACGPGIDSDH